MMNSVGPGATGVKKEKKRDGGDVSPEPIGAEGVGSRRGKGRTGK